MAMSRGTACPSLFHDIQEVMKGRQFDVRLFREQNALNYELGGFFFATHIK